jgi:hypothetical protein
VNRTLLEAVIPVLSVIVMFGAVITVEGTDYLMRDEVMAGLTLAVVVATALFFAGE